MSEKQKPNSSRGQSAGDDSVPVEEAARPDVVGNRPAPVEAEDEVEIYQERRVRIREDINERHADDDVELVRCDVPTVPTLTMMLFPYMAILVAGQVLR